jgi:hypothetical protein
MNTSVLSPVDSLLEAAKRLTQEERVAFFDRFSESLDDEFENEDEGPPLSPEWMAEIDRRVAEVEAGTCQMHDWQDVLQEARESLQRTA